MNMTRRSHSRWLLAGLLLLAACQRAPDPVAFRGVVTLDGQPLDDGRLQLIVAGEPPEVAEIRNGQFHGKALPGPKRVEIYAFRPGVSLSEEEREPSLGAPIENLIPARYNVESTLTAEVAPHGPNDFEFALATSTSP